MANTPTSNDHASHDMRPHDEMWATFGQLAKWTIGLAIVLLAFMAFFLTGGHPPPH